jgi:hypothetical protein
MSKRRSDPHGADPSGSHAAEAPRRLLKPTFRASWRMPRIGLPVLLIAALITAPAAIAAAIQPVSRAGSACSAASPAAAARAAVDGSRRDLKATARGLLGKRGELTGRVLTAQSASGAPIGVALPIESFVGAPTDDLIVYTTYTAVVGSQVRALDLVTGCDALLASPPEIVRSAILDPVANALYVHSVKKSGRADAGVIRYQLSTGDSAQAVPPLRTSAAFGPIFGTELRWSDSGRSLAIQSCGMFECLTRILEPGSGEVATYDTPGQGQLISLDGERLVTFAACGGLPCDVLGTDLVSGEVTVIAANAMEVTQ